MSGAEWAAWIAAGAAVATVVIYIVLGVFASRQVKEARTLREEQARPFVVVDFEPGFLIYISVANVGRTMARDVRIQFDKPLQTTLQRPHEIEESPLFREPIPMLAPGKRIRVLFDSYPARMDTDLPATYDVNLQYRGTTKRLWKDHYRLDLGMYLGSALAEKGLPDLVQELEKVRKEMAKWSEGSKGLRAFVIDREKNRRREERPWIRRQGARVKEEEGNAALARWLWARALRRRGWR